MINLDPRSNNDNLLGAIIDKMVDGFIITDTKGVILLFNRAAERIFGYSLAEALGQNVSILMPQNEAAHHDDHLARYKKKGVAHAIGIRREIVGKRKDGSVFPIEIALNDITNNGRRIFTAVISDISTRVLAQTQLKEQNETLTNILVNTNDAYLTLDRDWVINYANPRSESLLAIQPEQVIGKDLRDELPDFVSMFYKLILTTFKTRQAQEKEVLYGPTMKYIEARAFPTTDGLIINFRDITARRKSEEKLRLARETEFRNSEKLKLAAELASYMTAIDQHALVSVTDASGKIIQANSKFSEVSGYSQQELLGQDHRIVNSGTHPKAFFNNLWETISQGKNWHGEICNRAKDGTLYWVDSAIVPIKGDGVTKDRYISVRIDITERKRQEAEIANAYQNLSEANSLLEKMSLTDDLTQVANRRHFDKALSRETEILRRTRLPLSLLLCDIDFFKNYNDSYGHQKGDRCLQQVASTIDSCFPRSSDLVARYGGEEFAVILPNVDKETALNLAEKVRATIEQLQLEHNTSMIASTVTISIGVTSQLLDQNSTPQLIIENADKALYLAKEKGRNNVQCV